MSYKNPILTELYVLISFNEGTITESQIIDAAAALKKIGFIHNEFVLTASIQTKNQAITRIRCWDEDRVKLIQFSKDVIVFNFVKKYLGWDRFVEFIKEGLSVIGDSLEGNAKEIDMHTIDTFSVPKESFKFGDWINCDGNIVPRSYEDASVSLDVILGKGVLQKNGVNRQIQISSKEENAVFSLKIDATFQNHIGTSGLFGMLEELHDDSLQTFESIITDKVRIEIMGGES